MNRNVRLLIVLLVAVAAAGIASFAAYRAIQNLPVKQVEIGSVQTVVAARELPVGTLLTRDDVRLVAWPERSMVPGSFQSVDAVVNRGLVVQATENEPITESKLAAAGTGAGLPPTIPQGMRAISLKVNEVVGVAGFVVPGTRVDVVVTLRNGPVSAGGMSRIVLNNITVLASGTRYDQAKAQKDAQPIPTSVVTLLVTPEDAERLALAGAEGSITLVLRNPLDAETVKTAGSRISSLLGAPAPPPVERVVEGRKVMRAPTPPKVEAPKPYVVETIRAAKRSEEAIR
jgi:pilus assembly protein CpaB